MNFPESKVLQNLPKQFFASLVQKVNAKVASGADVINLGQGNPDQPTPQFIIDALSKAANDPATHKYAQFRGQPNFKQACSDFYEREYGVKLDPEKEIAVLGGSKIGLVELPFALMNPGETILMPDPGYPDYFSGVALAKVKLETFPLLEENDFLPDYSKIDPATADNAKLLYLNYPNNPTGAVATSEFYEETVDYAKKHEIGIVSDFAYGAIGFDGKKPISFLQTAGAKDVGIEFYSFSKTYNMAGWRLAFAAGNADMIEAINLIQDHLFVSVFPAIQEAGIAALNSDQKAAHEISDRYESRRNALLKAAAKINWPAYKAGGTFYTLMKVPAGYTSEQFSDLLLEKANVAVAACNGFGATGEGYVRIGLLVSEERLTEAVERVGKLNLF
ncbi:pyridoxal phosphate-dependent aminotransferase [Xylocopilactobacillus apis]|uniref:Aminotransferase n=1 Tax=Xylocopilactobacillus apis TaxID=2932183 RepID=A0AAU9D3I6_9LACO|nr:pyridoxal phosphate-dependent aminotransferase [Xylocopilactobacillus apis]BDR55960.1 diaminopimelate aminotransferase [Xylocopilactobacillus apis]